MLGARVLTLRGQESTGEGEKNGNPGEAGVLLSAGRWPGRQLMLPDAHSVAGRQGRQG